MTSQKLKEMKMFILFPFFNEKNEESSLEDSIIIIIMFVLIIKLVLQLLLTNYLPTVI